jgi:hypothetical protein
LREHAPRVSHEGGRFMNQGGLSTEQRDAPADLLGRVAQAEHFLH